MAFGRASDEQNTRPNSPTAPTSSPSMSSSSSSSGSLGAFLGNGSKVVGHLTFSGPVEVDGQIEGEITAQDKLTIGESAFVKGTVQGGEILVKGTVQGDLIATKRLTLKKPAKVTGNISTPNLNIEEGVLFDGKCSMGGTSVSKGQTKGLSSSVESSGKGASANL